MIGSNLSNRLFFLCDNGKWFRPAAWPVGVGVIGWVPATG